MCHMCRDAGDRAMYHGIGKGGNVAKKRKKKRLPPRKKNGEFRKRKK